MTLVGDAAGYVTKCSGEGIYFAAKSGRMAGEAIVKASEGGKKMAGACVRRGAGGSCSGGLGRLCSTVGRLGPPLAVLIKLLVARPDSPLAAA